MSSDEAQPISQVLASAGKLVSGTTFSAASLWASVLPSSSNAGAGVGAWLGQMAAEEEPGSSQDLQCVMMDAGMVMRLYGEGRSPQLLLGMLAAYLAVAHLCTYGALLLATRRVKHSLSHA